MADQMNILAVENIRSKQQLHDVLWFLSMIINELYWEH